MVIDYVTFPDPQEEQMGERCLILLKEFQACNLPDRYILDNAPYDESAIPEIVEEIRMSPRFRWNDGIDDFVSGMGRWLR